MLNTSFKEIRNKIFFLLLSFFFLFLGFSVQAQTEDEDSFSTEFTYGITINTNSGLPGGIVLKYAKNIDNHWSHLFFVEIVNVKNPKESRVSSSSANSQGYNTSSYIQYKLNNLYVIRPQYGREFLLFRKAPDQGVRIDAIMAGGLSIGLLKPYYIQYDYSGTNQNIQAIKFADVISNKLNPSQIVGSSGFQGFGEMNLKMGLNAKLGLSFEFGAFKNSVTGFDIGFLIEAYPKEIPIMYGAPNRNVFTSAYLTLFFGSRK